MERNFFDPRTWFAKTPVAVIERSPQMSTLRYTGELSVPFDGEKTPGLAGPKLNYMPDHYSLVVRSWQAVLESDLAIIATGRLLTWMIGKGLKLQSEPVTEILKEEGINIDKRKFSKQFELRWNLLRSEKDWDYSGQKTLDQLSVEAEKNAIIGGDVLVILRVIKGQIKIQHIDGAHVQSPDYGSEWYPKELADGHLIIDGVEMNERREHVAYWVKVYALVATRDNFNQTYKFERVAAYGAKTGIRLAYLYYGNEHRINTVRGMPLLAAMHEKLNMIAEYSDATLHQAKESAKVDYQQITDLGGKGEPIWGKTTLLAANGASNSGAKLPTTDDGVEKTNVVKLSNIGQVYVPPPGSKVEMLNNENPLYFKDFFETHADIFFAVVEIPPEVARGKFTNSFSASRMATGDWGNTLVVKRDRHYVGYQKPIIDLWLDLQILSGNIQAPGYISVRSKKDNLLLSCFKKVRLIGANVPAVDSLKEAQAARIILGDAAKHIPLDDVHSVTEALGNGDSNENIERFGEELQMVADKKIKPLPLEQKGSGAPEPGKKSKKGD